MTSPTTPSLPDALRACIELGERGWRNRHAAYGCVDFIRQHGPALEALLRERDELRRVLSNLHAMVWGECPSLLNEDSGGSGELDLDIRNLIEAKL